MPIAAALPELLIIIGAALLLVVLLVSVQLYQNGHQARSFALSLPVIATPVVEAIDWLLSFNLQAARLVDATLEGLLVGSVQALANLIVAVWKIAGATTLALIHHTAQQAAHADQLATHLQTVEVAQLQAQVMQLRAELANLRQVETAQLQAAVAQIEHQLATDLQTALAASAVVEHQLAPYLPMLSRLAVLPQDAAQSIMRLLTLTASLSVAVGALEAHTARLDSGVSALERAISGQQALLARLSVLLTLAGAGALAVAELVRIARNPCGVCEGIDLGDLEGRLASVELQVA